MQKPPPRVGLVIDIETRRHPDLKAHLGIDEKVARLDDREVDDLKIIAEAEGCKLGNRKNREAIYSKLLDHYDGMVTKAALRLYGNQVCAIGIGLVHDESSCQVAVVGDTNHHSEEDVLNAFLRYVDQESPCCIMGFHVRGFDIPVLRTRCMLLGLPWPQWLPRDRREDKYELEYVYDLRDTLDEGSLDTWLRVAGLPPKTSHGAAVETMSPTEIAHYCGGDVNRTRLMLWKTLPLSRHYELLTVEGAAV